MDAPQGTWDVEGSCREIHWIFICLQPCILQRVLWLIASFADKLPEERESDLKLRIQIQAINSVTILFCSGRLTYREEARAFSERMAELILSGSRVVIEMTGVDAIDSAGLGELAVIHMWARGAGCDLKIVGASGRLRRLFELTNLSSIFEIHSTLEEAVHAFHGKGRLAKEVSNAA